MLALRLKLLPARPLLSWLAVVIADSTLGKAQRMIVLPVRLSVLMWQCWCGSAQSWTLLRVRYIHTRTRCPPSRLQTSCALSGQPAQMDTNKLAQHDSQGHGRGIVGWKEEGFMVLCCAASTMRSGQEQREGSRCCIFALANV